MKVTVIAANEVYDLALPRAEMKGCPRVSLFLEGRVWVRRSLFTAFRFEEIFRLWET